MKTIRVADRKISEDLNIRSAVISYASAHGTSNGGPVASTRRDFLSATDVKWSHGEYDSIIATAANNGRISIYDIRRPEVELLWLHEHPRQVHKLGFNPFQGALLLSGSHDGTVKYWDLRASRRERSSLVLDSSKQFPGRAEAVRDLRWSPTDGVEFITCTDGGTIFKWDSRRPDRPELRINGHEKACYAVDWHPDGRHVVSGSADKNVRVWDFKNPDRRQKPCFQFRVPQTVMNIRWRPASWSSTSQNTGDWQSTQLAIGYNQDDPRVHVWDLRRPLIPFRELDRYKSPATSFLWCNTDLLWTVGNEGMFTQTDVQYSPQPPNQIALCTMNWLTSGEYAVFTEDRGHRCSCSSEDPSAGFREASHDEVSSGEQVTSSTSMTDDEGIHEHFLGPSYKRAHTNRTSARSVKSLGNSPPSRDDQTPVTSLDKSLLEKSSFIRNRQVGVIGETTGAAIDLPTVQFLAENYARPATEAERKQSPTSILKRLEEAFKINGDVCDQVSMHRLAQTWRILGVVILPELQAWADQHRRERLSQGTYKAPNRGAKTENAGADKQISRNEDNKNALKSEGIGTAQAVKEDLLRGVIRNEWQKITNEIESTSNMTTPLARPLPDSTLTTPSKSPRPFSSPNGPIEPIPPLPPSVISAHSTAAAASQALRNEVDIGSDVAGRDEGSSSVEEPSYTSDPRRNVSKRSDESQRSVPKAIQRSKSDWVSTGESRSSDQYRRQQNKRAALREYKFQARPILNFDASFDDTPSKGLPIGMHRHDSMESLQMFSESSSSSHKAKSMLSSESASRDASCEKPLITSPDWDQQDQGDSYGLSTSSSLHTAEKLNGSFDRSNEHHNSVGHRSDSPVPDTPFEFEPFVTPHSRHESRPATRLPKPVTNKRPTHKEVSPSPTAEELQSPEYIYADFAPIDISTYYTNGHAKPWSALPLVSQAIAFDLNLGENNAQFSAHLLMHIHPFFFHQKHRHKQNLFISASPSQTLADRLLQPYLSHRIIESIFLQHHTFLKSLSLHIPAAELRNLCIEFDVPSVYRPRLSPDEDPESNSFSLSINCTNPACSVPLNLLPTSSSSSSTAEEPTSCTRCHTPRPPCPICLSLRAPGKQGPLQAGGGAGASATAPPPTPILNLWTSCQSCGHAAHMSCMEAWLSRSSSEGECPSMGCGCDCADGEVRWRRVAGLAITSNTGIVRGVTAVGNAGAVGEEQTGTRRGDGNAGERKNVGEGGNGHSDGGGRTSRAGTITNTSTAAPAPATKDTWKAAPSAAVERTRGLLLRGAGSTVGGGGGGGGTGSESEREGGGRNSKVVRLMTPREERSRTRTGTRKADES